MSCLVVSLNDVNVNDAVIAVDDVVANGRMTDCNIVKGGETSVVGIGDHVGRIYPKLILVNGNVISSSGHLVAVTSGKMTDSIWVGEPLTKAKLL